MQERGQGQYQPPPGGFAPQPPYAQPAPAGPRVVSAKGFDGGIEFDGQTVTIRRDGFRARTLHGGAGTVSVPLVQVTAVEFKAPSYIAGSNWHGRFTIVVAGAPPRTDNRRGQHRFDDPFTVEFGRKYGDFEMLRDAVNAGIAALRAGPPVPVYGVPGPAPYVPPVQAPSLAGQLAQLGELYRQGVLSAAEFEAAKARLLGA